MRGAEYYRHVYKVERERKGYIVYELVQADKELLTDLLRVEKYYGKSNATGIEDYLRLRTSTSWDKSEKVTGLRPTQIPGVYYGDRVQNGIKSLLLFQFSEDRTTLFLDVFPAFYPLVEGLRQRMIKEHDFALRREGE